MSCSTAMIEAERVGRTFGRTVALDGLDLIEAELEKFPVP